MGINSKGTLQYPHTLSSPFAFQLELNIMRNWPILIFLVSWKIMKLQLTHVLNKTHEKMVQFNAFELSFNLQYQPTLYIA